MEYQQDEKFEPETVLLRRVAVKFVDDFDIPYEDGAEYDHTGERRRHHQDCDDKPT